MDAVYAAGMTLDLSRRAFLLGLPLAFVGRNGRSRTHRACMVGRHSCRHRSEQKRAKWTVAMGRHHDRADLIRDSVFR
jgi:hypothetical protein